MKEGSFITNWSRLLVSTTFYQAILQGIGFISGIIVIRILPVEEYAMYTLANAGVVILSTLADSGINAGAMSEGGKYWKNKKKLSEVIVTTMQLRKKLGAVFYLIVSPILYYLMTSKGYSYQSSILVCLTILPLFLESLSSKLLEIAPKLHQDVGKVQRSILIANISRVVLVIMILPIFPIAYVAIIIAAITQSLAKQLLKQTNIQFVDINMVKNNDIEEKLMGLFKRTLPTALYFSFSGQLVIWLVTFLGSSESLAEVGALTRISIIFGIVVNVFTLTITPRFARLPNIKSLLFKRYFQIQAVLVVVGLIAPLVVYLFTEQILWLLGNEYSSLRSELLIIGYTAGLRILTGGLNSINASRAYILHPIIHIPTNLLTLVVLIVLIKPSTTEEILLIDLFRAAIAPLIINFTFIRYVGKE